MCGHYPSLCHQTPTGFSHNDPGDIFFYRTYFHRFNDFTLSSSHFRLAFNQVQYYFSAKLKRVTCSAVMNLMFFLNCLRWYSLHYVECQKYYFQQGKFTFSKPRRVPEAPCGVASFASLSFSAPPSIFVYDPLTSPGAHAAAAHGTKHLSF